jgi:nicotinamide phosphoribosyltransferase
MDSNILLMTDSYKVGHWLQYPPGTQYVYSYFESRGGIWEELVFFGLQYIIKRYLAGEVVAQEKINEASKVFSAYFGNDSIFNSEGWQHILRAHHGRLPVKIKAVPEGTVVSTRNVLMTIENTDPQCYWLTSYLESILSQVWYPTTIATQSREMKRMIKLYLEETGDPSTLDFKLLDFGYRGSTSHESAGIGGAAYMVSFRAAETMAGVTHLRKSRNASCWCTSRRTQHHYFLG